jgi:hypothetical protein
VIFYFLCSLLTRVMAPHSSTLCFLSIRIQDMNNLKYGGSSTELLGGLSENQVRIPEHRRKVYANVQVRSTDDARGDKESPKDCSCLQNCESCYTCSRAPFIGRRRDLHSENALESKEYF